MPNQIFKMGLSNENIDSLYFFSLSNFSNTIYISKELFFSYFRRYKYLSFITNIEEQMVYLEFSNREIEDHHQVYIGKISEELSHVQTVTSPKIRSIIDNEIIDFTPTSDMGRIRSKLMFRPVKCTQNLLSMDMEGTKWL